VVEEAVLKAYQNMADFEEDEGKMLAKGWRLKDLQGLSTRAPNRGHAALRPSNRRADMEATVLWGGGRQVPFFGRGELRGWNIRALFVRDAPTDSASSED
jgi:hypothetical protein